MVFHRLSNLFSFDKLRPNLQNLYRERIRERLYLARPTQQSNFSTNSFLARIACNKRASGPESSQKQAFEDNFKKYGRNFKYLGYFTAASCAFSKNPDDSGDKREEERETHLLGPEASEDSFSTADPFDDEDVVYYYKNYTYESPSKDNKFYYEIKRFKYPNSKDLPKSIDSDIDSFFVNPFYGYFKRIKDHLNSVLDDAPPIVYTNGSDRGLKMDPFWVVLSNTPPTTFSNAFLLVCGAVFALWKLGENSVNTKLSDFMNRHFLASYESIKSKRYHTLLTSAISHSSLVHFGLNCMLFHQLMKTFHNNMAMYTTHATNTSLQTFIRNIFSSNNRFEPGSRLVKRHGRVSTNDIFNVMFLSSLASSLGHVYFYKSPVLGASGAISGLMYLLASTFPNSFFRTVFPLPGLNLSILQIGQLFVATNVCFLLNGRSPNIAWAAHLMGMGAGALYCFFQQYVNKRPGFHNPFTLSVKTAKSQWKRTFQGFGKY